MRGPSERAVLRRTLVRHAALTALVAVVVSGLVTVGVLVFAQQDAYRAADRVARQVASAVIVPLSHHDFAAPVEPVRADLGRDLAPFLASGMVHRVKVWTVRGDDARIAFSDERRVEGATGHLDPDTALRLDAGEVLVRPVPNDAEHRFEVQAAGSLLEVFLGFRDVRGAPTRLEVYVPTDEAGTARHTAAAVLPMLLGGIALLAVATLPLSVALARRMERARAEQRAARRYGLAAAESSRQEMARHLHDGVIPDLAGASLLLDAVRAEESGAGSTTSRELLDHAHDLLTGEVQQLRTLLRDLVPPNPVDGDLASALHDLVARLHPPGPAPDVTVDVSLPPDTPEDTVLLLYRVSGELLRNAFRHAGAAHVRVRVTSATDGSAELTVADDGAGFDPDRRRPDGHVGLLLVGRAVDEHGGHLEVTSAPGAGTTVVASLPPGPERPVAEAASAGSGSSWWSWARRETGSQKERE